MLSTYLSYTENCVVLINGIRIIAEDKFMIIKSGYWNYYMSFRIKDNEKLFRDIIDKKYNDSIIGIALEKDLLQNTLIIPEYLEKRENDVKPYLEQKKIERWSISTEQEKYRNNELPECYFDFVNEGGRYGDTLRKAYESEFMKNPQEYVATGNDTIDSLLNYKIQKAKDVLNLVETKIRIPEKLNLHSFDLNVVLGNLLDNAIDASVQTKEKELKITMKLDKGVLFLNICNSCRGIAEGKRGILETTKSDKMNHGIGLKNVRRIVEKYHGDMEFLCENGSMEADIMIYVKDM